MFRAVSVHHQESSTVHTAIRYCPKHVESYSKNKFEKLAHLVSFIIRIYHDARSSECQICFHLFFTSNFLFSLTPFDVIRRITISRIFAACRKLDLSPYFYAAFHLKRVSNYACGCRDWRVRRAGCLSLRIQTTLCHWRPSCVPGLRW